MSPLRRWAPRVAVLVFGAVLSLAFPNPSWWWLAWFGLVPILLLVARAPGRREALVRGWLAGTGFMGALHHWLAPHLSVFMVPAAAFAGLFWIPLGWIVWATMQEQPPRLSRSVTVLVVFPSAWVVVEAARSWEYLGGAWGHLGARQWQVGPVVGVAALGGVWLVGFLLAAVNIALATAVLQSQPVRQRMAALGVAAVMPAWPSPTGSCGPSPGPPDR